MVVTSQDILDCLSDRFRVLKVHHSSTARHLHCSLQGKYGQGFVILDLDLGASLPDNTIELLEAEVSLSRIKSDIKSMQRSFKRSAGTVPCLESKQ